LAVGLYQLQKEALVSYDSQQQDYLGLLYNCRLKNFSLNSKTMSISSGKSAFMFLSNGI